MDMFDENVAIIIIFFVNFFCYSFSKFFYHYLDIIIKSFMFFQNVLNYNFSF